MTAKWNTGKPPNEKLVEVGCDGEIIKVMAFFGRDGYLPHWRSADETRTWPASAFREWREIETEAVEVKALALDVSLEKARALHRVWRALNDGDCPKCHKFHAATEIIRWPSRIICPSCDFFVGTDEITKIETMFAPAMDAAVAIFEAWRAESK